MTKIDIISGFLGAGKTTLIRKLLDEALKGQKIVLIENEFGEIGIDGGFLKDAGVQITEMNSGCICCSLVGDFGTALQDVLKQFAPDRIIIEPSGVGKLSDVMKAVLKVADEADIELSTYTAVADAMKCKMFMKNFGEFYNNQIESAKCIVLSRTQKLSEKKLDEVVAMIREKNPEATIVTTPWDDISGAQIMDAMEKKNDFVMQLMEEEEHDHDHCGCDHDHDHEHHHHDHDHDHEEHDHHDHDHDHEGHDHHDHDHDHEEHDHHDHEHHEHHYDEHGNCSCGHHHHDHEGHHHADDVFTSWGTETHHKYTDDEVQEVLERMANSQEFGMVLRAKGMIQATDGTWIYFDLVPGEYEIRKGEPEVTGRLCVIGTELKTEEIERAFRLK
ncbi:GTP-binding protein [Oscillospiraceae bacterium Marseille-Q3528]|nr:GTP-binding protein [Oscillospiraceae bacterium Marseille-Q3528]